VRALVWDASALHHAARADRLDVFGDVAKTYDNLTTAAVLEELAGHGLAEPVERSDWLRVVHVDGLEELPVLVGWVARLSAGVHHRGEATVCTFADVHGGTAVIDDRDACRTARTAGLDVHGSLWVLAAGVRAGAMSVPAADGLVATLVREGARYPLRGQTFSSWAGTSGLL
jgi:predicted nucleic acid-binding protein